MRNSLRRQTPPTPSMSDAQPPAATPAPTRRRGRPPRATVEPNGATPAPQATQVPATAGPNGATPTPQATQARPGRPRNAGLSSDEVARIHGQLDELRERVPDHDSPTYCQDLLQRRLLLRKLLPGIGGLTKIRQHIRNSMRRGEDCKTSRQAYAAVNPNFEMNRPQRSAFNDVWTEMNPTPGGETESRPRGAPRRQPPAEQAQSDARAAPAAPATPAAPAAGPAPVPSEVSPAAAAAAAPAADTASRRRRNRRGSTAVSSPAAQEVSEAPSQVLAANTAVGMEALVGMIGMLSAENKEQRAKIAALEEQLRQQQNA